MTAAIYLSAAIAAVAAVVSLRWTPSDPTSALNDLNRVWTQPDASRDFSASDIARATAFHDHVRPWQLAGLAASILVPLVMWWLTVRLSLHATTWTQWCGQLGAVVLATQTVSALLAWQVHRVMVHAGLDTRSTGSWFADALRTTALSFAVSAICLAVIRRMSSTVTVGRSAAAAALAAAAVIVFSFIMPLVVEPLFNKFTPMPAGPLRTSIMKLSNDVGVPVSDVLVADASRRTTTLNAYVSGFGATKRVVVYDTLIKTAPQDEVMMVVAHELGHVAARDVAHNTIIGALWAAALAPLALGFAHGRRGYEVAALLCAIAIMGVVSSPVSSAMSRRIETRADAFALRSATSVEQVNAEARMQKRLAITNLASPTPPRWVYLMFATHPTAPERIALARSAAAVRGWTPVPHLVNENTP